MKKATRFLAFLLIFTMLFAMMPLSSFAASTALKGKTIIALGDSLTDYGGDYAYATVLGKSEYLGTPVINAGVGGDTTRKAFSRFYQDVLSKNPDVVTICLGMNDQACLIASGMPNTPFDVYREQLTYFATKLQEIDCDVIFVTPQPVVVGTGFYPEGGGQYGLDYGYGYMDDFCNIMREVALDTGSNIVDIFYECDFVDVKKIVSSDGIHQTNYGREQYAKYIAESMLAIYDGQNKATMTVKCVDEKGNLLKTETITGKAGAHIVVPSPEIPGYTTTDADVPTTYVNGKTFTFTYSFALDDLIGEAMNIAYNDYSTNVIEIIRNKIDEAQKISADSNSTVEQIVTCYTELKELLKIKGTENYTLSVGASYTTTAPNRTDAFNDDGVRLTDGVKGYPDGREGYSGWNNMHPNYVNIPVDLGSKTEMDKFRAYAAAGNWGVSEPKDMVVYVSDDGSAWKQVGTTTKPALMSNTDTWDTYILELVSEQVIEARYVRFSVKPSDTFVWLDEVEVIRSIGKEAAEDSVYVNGFNTEISAGKTQIFTPDFGTINVTTANIKWATWLIAEWDSAKSAYVVKSVGSGNGSADASVTLTSNQIMIAAHQWDIYETSENPVIGSQKNRANVSNAKAGDVLVMNGVNITNKTIDSVAPHITIAHTHKLSSLASCDKPQVCNTCEKVIKIADDHNPGEWTVVYDATPMKTGLKEQTCTLCGCAVKYEVIPATSTTLDNLAKGKSYATSAPYSTNGTIPYPDENGKTLTDGALAPEDAIYSNEAFVGFNKSTTDYKNDGYIYITVDLGKTYRLETFVAYFASKFNGEAGVYAPTQMSVYVSDDNKTWVEADTVSIKDSNAVSNVAGIITLDRGVFGRYVQFRVVNDDHNWIMVSEVAVYGDEQTYIIGDVNNDGKVDSVDYLLVKRACFNTYALDPQEELRADVNGDKIIDSTDYLLVKRIAFGTYVA